jgi:hypothetical protein
MRLTAPDGTSLALHPRGYQFPAGTGEFDDQWLVISGQVTAGGRSWSFDDPCLLVDEARELGSWLRHAGQGHVEPQPEPAEPAWEPSLWFTEPVLAFSVAARDDIGLVVRVHCSLEAAPPWLDEAQRSPWGYAVFLRVDPDQLQQAADQWTDELNTLLAERPPTRPPRRLP